MIMITTSEPSDNIACEDDAALTGMGIMKVVLGSVNRRLDRQSKELHRKLGS